MKCNLFIYKNGQQVNFFRYSDEEALANMCIAFSHTSGRNGIKKAYFKKMDRCSVIANIEAIIEFKPLSNGDIFRYEYFFAGVELEKMNLGM